MTTVRELIGDSLIQLGVLAAQDSMQAEDAAFGLRELNRMIASWNTEDLMVYTVDRSTFPFVVGKQTYTLGVGGDFNTTYAVRPGQIDMVSALVNGVEIPIEILNDEQWRDTSVKSVNSTFPLAVWSNGNYPLNTLTFWPIPQQVNTVVLYLWGQTTAFASVNTTVTLPQGYEDAIVSNLAVRLSPGYGVQPSPVLVEQSKLSKQRIKEMNWEPTYRSVDGVLLGNGASNSIWRKSRGYVLD